MRNTSYKKFGNIENVNTEYKDRNYTTKASQYLQTSRKKTIQLTWSGSNSIAKIPGDRS